MFKKTKSSVTQGILLAISFIIVSLVIMRNAFAQDGTSKITIYHTNDMHGNVGSCYNPDGKLLQIGLDVIKSMKDNTPNSILVDAGDASQGSALASYSKGTKIIELMNSAEYDVVALGNHDFDYGILRLRQNVDLAKFPILSANVLNEDGTPFLKNDTNNGCNLIKEFNGKKIGFFAINTTETGYKTNPDNVKGLKFEDEVKTSLQQVKELKEQNVDLIVGIMHLGNSPSTKITSKVVAKNVPGIDIIIDGHSHEEYTFKEGNTIIQQVGTASKKIGKIEIEFKDDGKPEITAKIVKSGDLIDPNNPDAYQYIPNADVKKLCDEALNEISNISKTVIGRVNNGLYGGNYEKTSICRLGDTNLGNLMGDALVKEAKRLLSESNISIEDINIVSLQNGGGVRGFIPSGFITIGDVLNVFPFENKVSVKKVVPKQLYEILENGVKTTTLKDGIVYGSDGAFPNVGGMRYEFDINEPAIEFNEAKDEITFSGSRIKKIVLLNDDGTDKLELSREDTETEIAFISNSFETSGGDQYIMLKDLPYMTDDGNPLHVILSDYIKYLTLNNNGFFTYPSNMSRAKIIGSENLFSNFDVQVSIKENSLPVKNKPILVSIDNSQAIEMYTDENGNIVICGLEPGPHDIKFQKDRLCMNNYVNNYLGINKISVFLENKSSDDINSVMDIINGISAQSESDYQNYVNFARISYDNLTDEEKKQVTNYNILLASEDKAEEKSNSLRNNIIAIVIICLIVALCSIAFMLIYKNRKI